MIGRDFLSQLSAAPSLSGSRAMPAATSAGNATGMPAAGRSSMNGFMSDGNRMMQPTGSPMAGGSFGSFGGMSRQPGQSPTFPSRPFGGMAGSSAPNNSNFGLQPGAAPPANGYGLASQPQYASLLSLLRGFR